MTEEPTGKGYCLKVLEELGQHPAISFMEDVVAAAVTQIAAAMGVPVHADPYGNLITTYMGPRSDDADMPTIAFVAHMDHPGFEVIDEDGDSYVARALGGVPPASFYPGVPLSIATKDGAVLKAATSGRHGAEDQRMITLELDQPQTLALPAPAVLDLPSFLLKDGLAHMRAADDLAGCAAILAATKELVEGDREANQNVGRVHGIFTLAEEVGLVGARLLAEAGNLPKDSLIVSLEASRSLPGALLGEGPVIRVGDASFTFDAEAPRIGTQQSKGAIATYASRFQMPTSADERGHLRSERLHLLRVSCNGSRFTLGQLPQHHRSWRYSSRIHKRR